MSYTTLLVHLQIGQSNEAVLKVIRSLAKTYKAAVLGVAVTYKTQNLHEEDYVFSPTSSNICGKLVRLLVRTIGDGDRATAHKQMSW